MRSVVQCAPIAERKRTGDAAGKAATSRLRLHLRGRRSAMGHQKQRRGPKTGQFCDLRTPKLPNFASSTRTGRPPPRIPKQSAERTDINVHSFASCHSLSLASCAVAAAHSNARKFETLRHHAETVRCATRTMNHCDWDGRRVVSQRLNVVTTAG